MSNSEEGDKRLRVGVAGLGVVGEGAALRLLDESGDFRYCGALVRDASKPRAEMIAAAAPIVDDLDAFLAMGPDVVLDATPDGDSGRALIRAALAKGIHVISANKQAVAGNLAELHGLAKSNDAILAYSASVGGGAPMVETVRAARASGEIASIKAILNGTVNYILTQIERGGGFDDAVKAAQDAGFAEPDPTADLSGDDAKAKISILAYEACGREPAADALSVEALDADKAQRFGDAGGAWRQITSLEIDRDGSSRGTVKFEQVDTDPVFAGVVEEGNAVQVVSRNGAVESCTGLGAGRVPTVGSLFADLYAIRDAR